MGPGEVLGAFPFGVDWDLERIVRCGRWGLLALAAGPFEDRERDEDEEDVREREGDAE